MFPIILCQIYRPVVKRKMGKSCKVVVCGQGAVGKTAVLEQLLYANHVAGIFLYIQFYTYM